ncbi:arginine deiminase family protein [uncultured Desulfobacter sp.]|uniref:dimethylarginine dimethylaminohydrolase family protein n=1 Tax=uncultured Desulfobacter sp. TaxID=240139 RepID=UPI002AABE1EE|nr:arginine deiminase family protein [uncultured Desulfobacter sp.]
MFKYAIVKTPASTLTAGITASPELGAPDYAKALEQHQTYIRALEACGVGVTVLDPDENFPDSCFIEDVAVCTRAFAMVTRPGARSRMGEQEDTAAVLSGFYDHIEQITAPGTLEGGDVMMVKDHYYIGLSDRTNREGAAQLIAALSAHGMDGSMVEMSDMLHLKTGLSYLEENILLAAGEFKNKKEFRSFDMIEIPEEESYAANCIRVNDYVIVPEWFPKTRKLIEDAGLKTMAVDTSEFRKLDGGLSCLSLRF